MVPIEAQEDIVAALPAHLVRFERFANCGHSVIADAPAQAFAVFREFIIGRQRERPRPPDRRAG